MVCVYIKNRYVYIFSLLLDFTLQNRDSVCGKQKKGKIQSACTHYIHINAMVDNIQAEIVIRFVLLCSIYNNCKSV